MGPRFPSRNELPRSPKTGLLRADPAADGAQDHRGTPARQPGAPGCYLRGLADGARPLPGPHPGRSRFPGHMLVAVTIFWPIAAFIMTAAPPFLTSLPFSVHGMTFFPPHALGARSGTPARQPGAPGRYPRGLADGARPLLGPRPGRSRLPGHMLAAVTIFSADGRVHGVFARIIWNGTV